MFNNQLLDMLLLCMQRQKKDTSYNLVKSVTVDELKRFFGIVLYMGIHKLPNRRMYWGNFTSVPGTSTTMTRNRFDEILSILHFNDNNTALSVASLNHNKLYKVHPIIDHFRTVFKEVVIPETCRAIDEMMIPFKGHHGAKMYMPKKPVKWGYKLLCRARVSGYVYDFEVVGGIDAKGPPKNLKSSFTLGESENVVLHLTNVLEQNKHKVFFDNLFASPELLIQ